MEISTNRDTSNVNVDNLSIESSISILTNDDMLIIFSYLSFEELLNAAQVCVSWSEIVIEKFAYQRKLISDRSHNMPINSAVDIVKCCGPRLQELVLTGFGDKVNDESIEKFASSCPNLLKLDLSKSEIGDKGIRVLTEYCKNLQEINLRDCANVTDDGVEHLMRSLTTLKALSVSTNSNLNGKCFRELGPQIERLTLKHVYFRITTAALFRITFYRFTNLKELCLIGNILLGKVCIQRFCQSCVNIKKLQISSTDFENHIFFEISKMTWLEELNLSNNWILDNNTIANISRGCRNLRILDISDPSYKVSDYCLSSIADNCRQLVELNISRIRRVGMSSFRKLGEVGILRRLIACDCRIYSVDLIHLVTHCHQLTFVDISGCTEVDKSILKPCLDAVQSRDNNVPLKLIVGDTLIKESDVVTKDPLLIVDFHSNSNRDACRKREDYPYQKVHHFPQN